MNRFLKLAGTAVCGSGALLVLSGCWHAPRPQDQTSAGTVYEPSGAATYSYSGAPVDTSNSGWQQGYGTYKTKKTQSQATAQQSGNYAPVDNSSSQWQQSNNQPQAKASARSTVNEPAGAEAQVQTQPSTQTRTYTSQPITTEGPNSGGKWRPGYVPAGTAQPAASQANGWLPGYGQNRQSIHESSGANWETIPSGTTRYEGTYQSQRQYQSGTASRQQLEQQLNNQQQQINQLQQQLNQQQHQLNQQQQTTPSSSTSGATTPSSTPETRSPLPTPSSSSTTPSSTSDTSTGTSDDNSQLP
jgi:hypothetical protein